MPTFKRTCSLGLASLLVAGLTSLAGAQTEAKPSAAHKNGSKSATSATTEKQNTSDQNKSNLSSSDKSFMKDAAEGGLAEVELGQLAADKASNPDVKKFGERMVKDHTKANCQGRREIRPLGRKKTRPGELLERLERSVWGAAMAPERRPAPPERRRV